MGCLQLKPKVPICNEVKDKFKTSTAPIPGCILKLQM